MIFKTYRLLSKQDVCIFDLLIFLRVETVLDILELSLGYVNIYGLKWEKFGL